MANGNWGGAASQFSEVEVDAIQLAVANGIATYAAGEIESLAGVPATLTELLALAEVNCYPRPFVIARSSGPTGPIVAAASGFAAPYATPTNPSGNLMRIIQSTPSAHGMGVASDGAYLWVQTSAGVPTGIYEISTRASANQIDVDVGAANQSLITSTTITDVFRVSTNPPHPIIVITVPGGMVGPNGKLEIGPVQLEFTPSTDAKLIQMMAGTAADGTGGTQMGSNFSSANATYYGAQLVPATLINQNDAAVQRLYGANALTVSAAVGSSTIDTTDDFYMAITARVAAVDTFLNVVGWVAVVTPGV